MVSTSQKGRTASCTRMMSVPGPYVQRPAAPTPGGLDRPRCIRRESQRAGDEGLRGRDVFSRKSDDDLSDLVKRGDALDGSQEYGPARELEELLGHTGTDARARPPAATTAATCLFWGRNTIAILCN